MQKGCRGLRGAQRATYGTLLVLGSSHQTPGFSHHTPGSLALHPGLLAPHPGIPLRAPGLPEWTARNRLRVQGFQHPAPWAGHSTPCTTGVPALETRHPARTQRSPALDTWHLNRRSWRQIRNGVLHTDARDPRPRQAPRRRVGRSALTRMSPHPAAAPHRCACPNGADAAEG